MTDRLLHLLFRVLLPLALGCAKTAPTAPTAHATGGDALAPAARGQLARVRPAGPACPGAPHGGPQLLVTRAEVELEDGNAERALACADEALRDAPRSVPALHIRAAALAASKRMDEARLAFAHALAIDPDDPETLRGAADLYVSHADGERSSLQLGLEYATRGARIAGRGPKRDAELVSSLLLLAATAENDLGESSKALAHADTILRTRKRDPDALYERGVALYELCRFAEARAALEGVLAALPDDAWATYYLSLVAERGGDGPRAEALARRARELAPEEIPTPVNVGRAAFEREVHRAVASLPEPERLALRAIPIEVAEVPSLEDLTSVDPPLSPSILGLFRGPPERDPCLPEDGPRCRSIVVYRRNLIRFARSRPELDEQVRVTLLHELGHLHGESDDDLRARGLE